MSRRRFFRGLLVKLECGCTKKLNTSRYRVGKDVAAVLLGDAARRGVWCNDHPGMGQVTEYLGVVPFDSSRTGTTRGTTR